jgi:glycosyltransferase involved in cell wall biosynthesis
LDKGLVSIGLAAYNRPEELTKALNCILSQTYRNIEVIISNNASDNQRVQEVIEAFAQGDSRIRYFQQICNLGVLGNAEFVLKESKGEYFAFMSDDDWRSPQFVEFLVAELEKHKNSNVAFCDYHEVYEDGTRAVGYPISHLDVYKPYQKTSSFFRRMIFYWQHAIRGKCNIFYGVYRRAALTRLDFKKISGDFTYLNLDCLVVFSILKTSSICMRKEVLCTLTCGNRKYYGAPEETQKKMNRMSRFFHFYKIQKEDRNRYLENTNSYFERISILFIFLAILARPFFKKIIKDSTPFVEFSTPIKKRYTSSILHLPNVTLIAMTSVQVEETVQALRYSMDGITFGKVKFLSHYQPYNLTNDIEFYRIDNVPSINDWCYKIIYQLDRYVDTEYILLVHADGFVVNPEQWKDEFFQYDYVGSPFPLPHDNFSYRDVNGEIVRVGNSVSLRSKRLIELANKLKLPWQDDHGFFHEDGFICVKNRHIYEAHGMKFAPLEVAKHFGHESMIPEIKGIRPFLFHKWAGTNREYPRF